MSDASKIVYTYLGCVMLDPPDSSCLEDAKRAIYAAHSYVPKQGEELPAAVRDACFMLVASQGTLVRIGVRADGKRVILPNASPNP